MRDSVHLAIVRKAPRASPKLACERVRVRKLDLALGLAADMRHADLRFDRILAKVPSERTLSCGMRLAE